MTDSSLHLGLKAWSQSVLNSWFGFDSGKPELSAFSDVQLLSHLLRAVSKDFVLPDFQIEFSFEDRVQNLRILLDHFEPLRSFSQSSVHAIATGSATDICSLLWKIASEIHLPFLFQQPINKAGLLNYFATVFAVPSLTNFTASWETGVPFCLLLHKQKQKPGILDVASTAGVRFIFANCQLRSADRCRLAWELAEAQFGLQSFLSLPLEEQPVFIWLLTFLQIAGVPPLPGAQLSPAPARVSVEARMAAVRHHPFYQPIDATAAEAFLQGRPPGTLVMRPAPDPSAFSLSFVHQNAAVMKTRVQVREAGFTPQGSQLYATLAELVKVLQTAERPNSSSLGPRPVPVPAPSLSPPAPRPASLPPTRPFQGQSGRPPLTPLQALALAPNADEEDAMVGDVADPMSKLGVSKFGQQAAHRERFNTQSAQTGRAFGLQSFPQDFEDEAMVGGDIDPMAKLGAAKLTEVTARRDRYNTMSAREGQAFGLALSLRDSPQRSLSPEPVGSRTTTSLPSPGVERPEGRAGEQQLARLLEEAEQNKRFADINNTADAQKYLSGMKAGSYIIRRTAQRDAIALSFVSEENQVRQLKILLTSGGFMPDDRNGAPTFATLDRLVSAFKAIQPRLEAVWIVNQRIGGDNSHYFTMRVECHGRPPYQVVLRFPNDFKKFHEQIRGHPALAGYKFPKGLSKVRNDKGLQKSERRLQLLLITCLETPDLRPLFQAFLFEQHELELELPDRADRGRRRPEDLAADPWGAPPPQRQEAALPFACLHNCCQLGPREVRARFLQEAARDSHQQVAHRCPADCTYCRRGAGRGRGTWVEHRDNGRPFYHNTETGESTWQRPPSFRPDPSAAPPPLGPASSVPAPLPSRGRGQPALNGLRACLHQTCSLTPAGQRAYLPDDQLQVGAADHRPSTTACPTPAQPARYSSGTTELDCQIF